MLDKSAITAIVSVISAVIAIAIACKADVRESEDVFVVFWEQSSTADNSHDLQDILILSVCVREDIFICS